MKILPSIILLLTAGFIQLATTGRPIALDSGNDAENKCKLYIPNAFSPNGDGVNDFFKPVANCSLQEFEMKIFDRWGTLIYQTKNIDRGWDGNYRGQEAESTAYAYYIQYRMMQQDSINATFSEAVTGNFALLR